MRSIWKGTISAGLLSFGVTLASAVTDDSIELHQVRARDGSRVRYRRFAAADGEEVPYADLAKGYEAGNGEIVIVGPAEYEEAYGEKVRDIEVVTFTDADALPRAAHDATYYVQPEQNSRKPYALLAQGLLDTGKVAVVRFALRERESLGLLSATEEGYLVLERVRYAAGLLRPDFKAPQLDVRASVAELSLMEQLIAEKSARFDWDAEADQSQERLQAVIDRKVKGLKTVGKPKEKAAGSPPVDLAEALKASVAQAKASRKPAPRSRKAKVA